MLAESSPLLSQLQLPSVQTALVLAHVNKHMYTFCSPPVLRTNKAPVKSTPVTLNGAAHNVRDLGSGGASGTEYGLPETFWQITHFLTKFLTV